MEVFGHIYFFPHRKKMTFVFISWCTTFFGKRMFVFPLMESLWIPAGHGSLHSPSIDIDVFWSVDLKYIFFLSFELVPSRIKFASVFLMEGRMCLIGQNKVHIFFSLFCNQSGINNTGCQTVYCIWVSYCDRSIHILRLLVQAAGLKQFFTQHLRHFWGVVYWYFLCRYGLSWSSGCTWCEIDLEFKLKWEKKC